MSKHDAQRRADQITAFRAELDQLARDGVAPFAPSQLATVAAHHDRLLAELARRFDVDRGAAEKRMSLGMRLASLLGAAALTAAIVSFVYRVWGALPQAGQVTLITAAPIAATIAMIVAGRIERTRYVASLFAIAACGSMAMQTIMLGQLFNQRGSPHLLAVWSVFAFTVALPWRFGIPFAFGLLTAVAYLPALAFAAAGVPWVSVVQRPEPAALVAAVLLLALEADLKVGLYKLWGKVGLSTLPAELRVWARSVLIIVVLGTILILSATGSISLLPIGEPVVKGAYQVLAVLAAIATMAHGLRRGLPEVVVLGSLFAGAFLLLRFVDWWWDWMPKYLFFLVLAALAMAWLWGLRAARRRLGAA